MTPKEVEGGHGGGEVRISTTKFVESRIMTFAAEHSRLNKEVANIDKFWNEAIEKLKVKS